MITPNYNFYSYAESVYENLKKRNNSEKSKNIEEEQITTNEMKLYCKGDKYYEYKIKEKKYDLKDNHPIYYLRNGKIIIHITKEEEKIVKNRIKIIDETLFIEKNNKLLGQGENGPKIFKNIEEYKEYEKIKQKQTDENKDEIKEYISLKDYFYNKYNIKNKHLNSSNIEIKKYKEIFSNSPSIKNIKTLSGKVEFLKDRIIDLKNNSEIFNLIKENNIEFQEIFNKVNNYIEIISNLAEHIMSCSNLLKYNEKNLKNLKECHNKICILLKNFKEDEEKTKNNKDLLNIKNQLSKMKISIETFLNRTKKNKNNLVALDFDYEKNSYFLTLPNEDIIYLKDEEYEKFLLNPNNEIFKQIYKNNINSINIVDLKNSLEHQNFEEELEKYNKKYIKKTFENLDDYFNSKYKLSINKEYLEKYYILKKEFYSIKKEFENFSMEYFEKSQINLNKIEQEENLMLKINILKKKFIKPLKNLYYINNRYINNIKNINIEIKKTNPLKKEIDLFKKNILLIKNKIKKDIDKILFNIVSYFNNKEGKITDEPSIFSLKKYLEELYTISNNNEIKKNIQEPKNILEDLEKIQNKLSENIPLNINKNIEEVKKEIKKPDIKIINKLKEEKKIHILNKNLENFIENYIKKSIFLLNDFEEKNTLKEKLNFLKKEIINPLYELLPIINNYNEIENSGLKIFEMNSIENNISLIREELGKNSNEILEIIRDYYTNPNSIETLYSPISNVIDYTKKNNKIILRKELDIYIKNISIINEKLENYDIKALENIKKEIVNNIENSKKYLIEYLTKIYEITNEKTKENKEKIIENIKNNVNSFIEKIINKKPEIYNEEIKKLLTFDEKEELKKINFKEDVILLESEYKNFNKIYKEIIPKEDIKMFIIILKKIISIHEELQDSYIFNKMKNNYQKTLYYLNEILNLEKKLIPLKKFYNQKPEILNFEDLKKYFIENFDEKLSIHIHKHFFNLYDNILDHIMYYKKFLIINYNNLKIDDYIKNYISIFRKKQKKLSLFEQLKFLDENCFKIIKDNLDLIEEIKTFYRWKCITPVEVQSILNYCYNKKLLDDSLVNLQKKLKFNFDKISEIYNEVSKNFSNNYNSKYKSEIEKSILANNNKIYCLNNYTTIKIKLEKKQKNLNLINDFIKKYSCYFNIQQDIKFRDIEEKRKSLNEEIEDLEKEIEEYEIILEGLRRKDSEINSKFRYYFFDNNYYYKEYEKYCSIKDRSIMRERTPFDFCFKNVDEKEIDIKNHLKELSKYIENNYAKYDEILKNNEKLDLEYIKNEYYDNFY